MNKFERKINFYINRIEFIRDLQTHKKLSQLTKLAIQSILGLYTKITTLAIQSLLGLYTKITTLLRITLEDD